MEAWIERGEATQSRGDELDPKMVEGKDGVCTVPIITTHLPHELVYSCGMKDHVDSFR